MRHFILLLLSLLSFLPLLRAQDSLQGPPHVLLIVIDDLGWNDVSYHGSEIKTPTLDRMAAEGVDLNRFYVHPACSPTRSSLMTGKTALRLGFINPIGKNNVKGLPLSEKIMPQYFKDNGYATYLVGKWHLGRFKKEYWPYKRGFDHFYGYLTGGVGHYDHVHGGALDWQRDGKTLREAGYSTHLLTDETIRIIEANTSEAPLFIELCYAAPHMPNEAPEAAVAEYLDIPDENRRLHAAMVSEVDRGIQKIYKALKKAGILDNTIIWVTSDNGGQSYAGSPESVRKRLKQFTGIWGRPLPFPFLDFIRDNVENGASDNRPLRGGKNTAYEGGVRVPALIYAPGLLSQQKIEARLTVNDILPTLADASNFKSFDTTNVDGLSQWAFLKQQAEAPEPPYVTAARYMQAYYKDDWKLIIPKEGETQLYKIKEDPEEKNNLANQHPEVVADLRADLDAFPRGEPVDDSIWKVFFDPDLFGGKEDREPFAGLEGNVKGPLHYSFYVAGFILLLVLALSFWLLRLIFKRLFKRKKG